jgi:hypothetical protein
MEIQNREGHRVGVPEFTLRKFGTATRCPSQQNIAGHFLSTTRFARRKVESVNTHSFFSRICHFPIFRLAAVTLVALAWSSLAFCGEIQDAAKSGDLEKVKALLKDNLDMNGGTPLYWAARLGHKDVAELLRQHGGHESTVFLFKQFPPDISAARREIIASAIGTISL